MSSRPFFLTRNWIGAGQVVTGCFMSGYSFIEILRYPIRGALPPLIGDTPMAFSTAVLFFACGLAWFWNGWDKRHNGYHAADETRTVFTGADIIHLAAAVISAIATLVVGLIAATR